MEIDWLKDENIIELSLEILAKIKGNVAEEDTHLACVSLVANMMEAKYKDCDSKYLDESKSTSQSRMKSYYSKINGYTFNQMKAFVLYSNKYINYKDELYATPPDVCRLADKILNISSSDKVLDMCSRTGEFIIESWYQHQDAQYKGVECNKNLVDVTKLKNNIFGCESENICGDVLDIPVDEKYDKIFSNPLFKQSKKFEFERINELLKRMNWNINYFYGSSQEWIYVVNVISHLKDNGKAAIIISSGALWNESDKMIRERLIEDGYIEAVISLPDKIFSRTSLASSMLILSAGNKCVRFINAMDKYREGRRINSFDDNDIEDILTFYNSGADRFFFSKLDLAKHDFILHPKSYIKVYDANVKEVKLKDICSNITRGAQIKAAELDSLQSNDITEFRYLVLSNIKNGYVESFTQQYLKEIPLKYYRYCIHDTSIVLSKIGSPIFKSAVVEVDESSQLLVNGSFFTLEINKEIANPYYIQSVFFSDLGKKLFESIYTGTAVPTLSADGLKNLALPLPEMEVQNKIAEKYMKKMEEVKLNTKLLEQSIKDLYNNFNI